MAINQINDPDYYYHVALSKEILANGFPSEIASIKGIGWNVLFTDKEYFFHVLTTLLYWIAGERGIQALPILISAGTVCMLTLHSIKQLGRQYFWIPLLIIAADPHFLFRAIMIRPHVLAIFFMTAIFLSFYYKKKYLVLASSALLALSYHGLQVPLLFIGASILTSVRDRESRHCILASLFGLIIGVLANPYFPGNVVIIQQITNIIVGTNSDSSMTEKLNYGNELWAWKSNHFLQYSIFVLVLLFCGVFTLGKRSSQQKNRQDQLQLFILFTLVFWFISFITPRGREYLIPALILLAIEVFRNRDSFLVQCNKRHKYLALINPFQALFLIAFSAQCLILRSDYSMLQTTEKLEDFRSYKALQTIPSDEKADLLNCNWSHGAFIYYLRPNIHFVDLLDPSFLYLLSKDLHKARMDLAEDESVDPSFVVKNFFKSKYVMCDTAGANLRMDSDPNFIRLYPETPVKRNSHVVALFQYQPEQSYFIKKFDYSFLHKDKKHEWLPIEPKLLITKIPKETKATAEYFDFLSHFQKKDFFKEQNDTKSEANEKELVANCIRVRPQQSELQNFLNSEFVGVGGGPLMTVYLNGNTLFESNFDTPSSFKKIKTFIPLPHKLTIQDKIEVVVCPDPNIPKFGLALSFWTQKKIENLCKQKNFKHHLDTSPQARPLYVDQMNNCLGTMANSYEKSYGSL